MCAHQLLEFVAHLITHTVTGRTSPAAAVLARLTADVAFYQGEVAGDRRRQRNTERLIGTTDGGASASDRKPHLTEKAAADKPLGSAP